MRLQQPWMIALMAAVTAVLLAPPAAADQEPATEDVIHMADGRELHGEIVTEHEGSIVFRLVNREFGLETEITLLRSEILSIKRDVPLDDGDAPAARSPRKGAGEEQEQEEGPRFGTSRRSGYDERLPSLYIVPMEGQMGTDVNAEIYGEMIDDIREHDPDYLIIRMECRDTEDRLYTRFGDEEKGLDQGEFIDEYRRLINIFRDDLSDVPQVLWIHDSHGISSVVALAWENLYMKPEARLGGIENVREHFDVSDPEVRAKFREAYMGFLKSFAEYGSYDLRLIDAMVLPQEVLSASFRGREVVWSLTTGGEYLVDDDPEATVTLGAHAAEELLVSDGTVETLDDLAFLLGLREYRLADGEGEEMFENYVERWRRTLASCQEWWKDYHQHQGWAGGREAIKWLGRAKRDLEQIINGINRYRAVEIRLAMEGLHRFTLETMVEQIQEQIRALRRGRSTGGGASGGSGFGPG